MTVYEMIQELAKYNADTEVQINVMGNYSATVEVQADCEHEEETDVDVDIDEYVQQFDIEEVRIYPYKPNIIRINAKIE